MSAKYPRTAHLPWSPGGTRDDRRMVSVEHLLHVPVVATEKMDGSNLCMTHHNVFARSHNGAPGHPSFAAAKALHAQIAHQIPPNLSVFGEWCFAVHSIQYQNLPGWFLLFGVRDDSTLQWWSFDETNLMAETLEVSMVPVLSTATFKTAASLEKWSNSLALQPSSAGGEREGVVVRTTAEFHDQDFQRKVGKWVRENHVQTDDHWSTTAIRKQPKVR